MASLQPQILTLNQIRNNITNVFVARSGINDLNEGSSVRDYIEASAMSDYRTQGSIIATLSSQDIDRATDSDLDKIGFQAGVTRPQAKSASGFVTIGSSTFQKISTQIYPGTAAPPAGSNSVNISDGSAFPPAGGSIYLGRGTSNLEGPIAYSSITQVGNFFTVNLSTPTTKNHNTSESVILAQGGNRVVSAGAVVQTLANETSAAVQFNVTTTVTVPDGEQSIVNVPVTCTQAGTIGNAAANSIVQFATSAFPGAFVTNPTSFVSGQDSMSDPDYRNLIKTVAQTRQKGTPLAIESAAIGVTSTDDNKTCTSASYRAPANRNEPGTLFISSGAVYEPIIYGQGFEPIIDNANGSEKFLQLQNEDLTKGILISTFTAPFVLTGGMKLSVKVGGILSEHIFQASDFATQNAASTNEVVTSINNDTSLLFSARAVNNDTQVAIFADAFSNDDLQMVVPVSFTNANDFMGFDSNLTYSLRLYEDDVLLYKDGVVPTAVSAHQATWNPVAFTSGATLILAVDGTPSITLTFVNSDFIPYGFGTVAATNSLASWAALINLKMGGITALVSGDQLQVVSNKGAVTGASLQVVGGTLVTGGNMFDAATYLGRSSDYALNRSTGQFELANLMSPGSNLTAGSKNTRGFVSSAEFSTGATTLTSTANDTAPRAYFILDEPAQLITVNIASSSGLTVSNVGDAWTYTSTIPTAFSNVMVGDWALVLSKSIPDSSGNKGFWRVNAATGSSITVEKVAGTDAIYVASGVNDVVVVRSTGEIQEVDFGTGTQTLGALAASVSTQLVGGFGQVRGATTLSVVSNTFGTNGSVFVAGFNVPAATLGFTLGAYGQSTVSHTAFAESATSELTIPQFIHDFVTADNGVVPPPVIDRTVTTNLSLSSVITPEMILAWLNPYSGETNNEGTYSLTGSITGTSVLVRGNNRTKDIIANDRYYVAQPFNFSGVDNLVAIVDKDPVNKSVNIPLFRNGTVSNQTPPTSTTFTAYDTDTGPTANYAQGFGDNYSFQDFKVLFHARQILDPSGPDNAMLIRFAQLGDTGNNCRIGIFYPVTPSTPVSSAVSVEDKTSIQVSLASDVSKTGGWASGSQFNVTNPAGNTYRYTWNGVGSAPNFTSTLPTPIAVGDVVTVASSTTFSSGNKGTFRVTGIFSTYFEVSNPSGVVESNIQLNASSDLTFYALLSGSNTATAIGTYINSNLSSYVSATQLESGSGTIATSTFDDTASDYADLVDGTNWLLSSNIGTTFVPLNQFTLKVPRSLLNSVSPPYNLVGETFRIVPVMTSHIVSFLNVFAVTGLSSLANVNASSNAGKVQIYSNVFGSSGAVQVTGGSGNAVSGAAQSSASVVNTNFTGFDINTSDAIGMMSNQWALISNSAVQAKSIVFGPSTQLQVSGSSPSIGFASLSIALGPGTFQTSRTHSSDNTTELKVESQGQFTAISWTGTGTAPNFVGGGVQEGDWVVVSGSFNTLNQGTFKVIKLYGSNTIYVQNPNAVEETVTLSANSDLAFYSYDSVMPGDQVVIENNVLGAANNGTFTVVYDPLASVPFPTPTTIYLASSTLTTTIPIALGVNFNQVLVNEQTPFFAYRQIQNFGIDPMNVNRTTVVITGNELPSKINQNAGSSISIIGKLNFNNLVNAGEDSYKYFGGLIHAVGQVVRGEPSDPVTLPGIAAAGSFIEIDAALPLPIKLSIVIRALTGTPFSLLQSRVQSVVSAYINSLGVNQPVVFSQIVSVANSVAGVQAVSISSPTYDSAHDIITVQPNEQAVIENATTDIVVSLAT